MRRSFLFACATLVALVAPTTIALADHPYPGFTSSVPLPAGINASGGEWELIASFPTGNLQTDMDFFTQDGESYVSVGTLGAGLNAGGQTIIQLTDGGEVTPSFVTGIPTASCITDESGALGLQHDVEATPKGLALLNTVNPFADTRDAQLIIDATDARGRCHDNSDFGFAGVPKGGLEIIDVTDVTAPVELALTSHIGMAHTVNIDPKRPHIAYAVTSDAISTTADTNDTDGDGDTTELIRRNEVLGDSEAGDLDGFEIVDLSSCMDFAEGTSVEDKRAACRPSVYRYRFPEIDMTLGFANTGNVYGCHELEVYPDDKLSCASGGSLLLLDMSAAFDDNGTPDDYLDDRVRGTELECDVRSSTSVEAPTAAPIIDCVTGLDAKPLDVASWIADGAPGVEGVEYLGRVVHMGRESTTGAFTPDFNSDEDIDFNHESELTHSGKFILATDERGGGVLPPGASCAPEIDNPTGNGGIHAYAVDRLRTEFTTDADEAFSSYARTPAGDKAIYRASINTGPQGSLCTAHVFQQIPGQNRVFMAWYTQGTQVVDYIEHPDGSFEWQRVGHFIPVNANQWTSSVFKMEENADGSWTYWGVAADFAFGVAGRSAIDVFKATLPAPAQMAGATPTEPTPAPAPAPEPAPAPTSPLPTTGGGIVLGSLALLGGAASIGRRRRGLITD